jgi:predicted ATPase/DNA-binding SARP family transcriptional activator/Tfp pilus assembly protein PilF
LFGNIDVRVDGEPVSKFKYAKVRALLAYLALESHRPLPRPSLAALLWPDQPENAARSSLSQALATLRRAMGPKHEAALRTGVDTIQLDPNAIQVDVSQFLALLREAETHEHRSWRTCTPCALRLEQAIALYRGNFLADFSLPDSATFEEWGGLQREHLLQRALSALQHLAEWQEWRGRYADAIATVRRQLDLEPYLEVNHRTLLRLLALNGEQSAALTHYQQLQALLSRELGARPEAGTTLLYNQVLQSRLGGLRQQAGFTVPLPPTPLVGRASELDAVCSKLQNGARLLTITGTAGIGKTRLALETAYKLRYDYEDGVYYVELAPLNDPLLVGAGIGRVLGLKERPGQDMRHTLQDHLRSKHLLLLLDNFEHVDQAATLVSGLLGVCPGVKFLVTSRKPLKLRAENLFPLQPLAEEEALQLFEQRAQAAGASNPEAGDRTIYREICRRLDGLPLAIELFAAQARVRSARELLAQIEQSRLSPLPGLSDLPDRQQTLRTAIQWSYDLLEAEQQLVFRRLGVFAGGCTVETLLAVVGESPSRLLAVEALQDASLVQVQATGGERRYILLQTLREFALEQLVSQGEAEAARRRHAETFLSLVELTKPKLNGLDQKDWFDRLERELANLRLALSWSQANAIETGLRIASNLENLWIVRGISTEGRKWLQSALQAGVELPVESRAEALRVAGVLARNQEDYPEARQLLDQSREIFLKIEDSNGLARTLYHLGTVSEGQADYPTALAYFQEGLDLARSQQDWFLEACALDGLALLAVRRGDYAQARIHDEQALGLFQAHHNIRNIAMTTSNLGIIASNQGDYPAARRYLETALASGREIGDQHVITLAMLNLANVQIAQGDYAGARANLEESIHRQRTTGDTTGLAAQLGAFGRALQKLGESVAARAAQAEALSLRAGVGDQRGVAVSLENLALVEFDESQAERAALLLGAAEAIRDAISAPITPSRRLENEKLVAAIRLALGQPAFDQAWAAGRDLTLEQAVELGLTPPPASPQMKIPFGEGRGLK